MAIFTPETETFQDQRFSMLLYGAPGVGKTTLACSAPKPLLIDLDKGIQRIKAQHRPKFSRVATYEELLEDLNSETLKGFETLVIDTGGALITLLQDYVMRKDPVNKTRSGGISQKGYGAVKLEFQQLTARFNTVLDKNIIYVFHSVEEKNKEGVAIQRLLCEGSAKNIVWQPCDFGAYIYMNGNERMAGFTPTDEYFAKGCYGISGVRKIPALGGTDKNDYITRLFDEANANIAQDNEYFAAEKKAYEAAMTAGKELIGSLETPADFNEAGEKLKSINHSLTSLEELRQLFRDRVKEKGYVFNREKKGYELPEAEAKKAEAEKQAAEEPQEKPVKKPVKQAAQEPQAEPVKKSAKAQADEILNELTNGKSEAKKNETEPPVEATQEELPINALRQPNAAYEALKKPAEKQAPVGPKVFEDV